MIVPWGGLHEVKGVVASLYDSPPPGQVLVQLTPDLSGWVIDEPTTVVWPLDQVRLADNAA